MLKEFISFVDALGNVDDGVESVLTQDAFDALVMMVRGVYGDHVAEVFSNFFRQREDGSLVMAVEGAGNYFLESLSGTDDYVQ